MSKLDGPVSYVKFPPIPGAGAVVRLLENVYDARYQTPAVALFCNLAYSA